MPRQIRNRNVRSEMKTLECLRCHKLIRLDEYKSHLATCGATKEPTPAPIPPTPETQASQSP